MGLENRHNCSQPDAIKSSDHRRDMPNSVKTDNSGLELTADMLEEIYTNKDFPKSALPLKVSLADSGKSRADLWSLAAAIGVEWGIERNNRGCDGERIAESGRFNCPHLREGEPECRIEWPEPLKFYTGRSDCESSVPGFKGYETTREESHPNPVGTGQMTVDFFKKDFGLTARQSAALLLGAHSIGSFNFQISQFRYDWTKNQAKLMNNQLFRNIVMKPQYYVACDQPNPYVGDYLGQPAATRWRVIGFECQQGGGPYHWFHQYYRVPASNTCSGVSKENKKFTRTPELAFPEYIPLRYSDKGDEDDGDDRALVSMRAEPDTPEGCCDDLADGEVCQESCQYLIKNGETTLGADMGFYFNFTVDPETGKPGGCDGLYFNQHNKSPTVNCGLNQYAPEGEPLHQIVEDYADHQDTWIQDFITAFDKMSKNGNTDLVDGPTSWFKAPCRLDKRTWICEPAQ